MIKNGFALYLLALLLPCLLHAQQTDDLLKWSAEKKLKWTDYLAEPDTRSDAAASTSTQVGFEYHIHENQLTYTVTLRFARLKSWGRYKNEYILSHEQGHFDIAEIFTRKFVKALREYQFNKSSYRNDLRKIYADVMKAKEQYQREYDSETDYSRVKEKQAEWLKKIAVTLEQYKDFGDY